MDTLPPHWRPLPDIPVIQRVWEERQLRRWMVLAAGRRALKTHLAKMRLVEAAADTEGGFFLAVGPTLDQGKRIFWEDLQRLVPPEKVSRVTQTRMNIRLRNGAEIQVSSEQQIRVLAEQLPEDRPRIDGMVLDHFHDMTSLAWPAARALVKKGWIWVVGTTPTARHPAPHFVELWQGAVSDTTGTWGAFSWPSSAVITAEELAAARRDLDPGLFASEYETCFAQPEPVSCP